ncbi:hypothetical protein [Natrinema ejinorense]|uniref:hypothetical protein n=1 Tax=Natrinema ejinorense TaxID=373386 RepID=UPI001180F03D|nr:hypothetical protein [Natrinema ejinorense]
MPTVAWVLSQIRLLSLFLCISARFHTSVTLLGVTGVTADDSLSESQTAGGKQILNEIELDTSSCADLEEASLIFLKRGQQETIRTKIHLAHDMVTVEPSTNEDPTKINYSISLNPHQESSTQRGVKAASGTNVESLDNTDVALERAEDTISAGDHFKDDALTDSGRVRTAGLDDPEFSDNGDAVTYVETKSSECGPLCRTNLVIERSYDSSRGTYDIDDSTGFFETVRGDTCDGEEFGD